MVKKRGKKDKASSKKQAKEVQKPAKDALRELEILAEEKKVENKVENVEKKEEEIGKKETSIIAEEKKIEKQTEKVEHLEKEIKEEVTAKPLTKLSGRDINKGIIGAFIGVVAHFAFIYGKEIAKGITTARATILIAVSYLLLIVLMYETGYRKVKDKKVIGILPIRATVIFLTSIAVIFAIFLLFNQIDFSDTAGLYKQIAVTSVLAALGAGTADLIGRD